MFSIEDQQGNQNLNSSVVSFDSETGDLLRDEMREQTVVQLSLNTGSWST